MLKTKYRIVTDYYCGYEVQRKTWWWPFWHQPWINTHVSVDAAERWVKICFKEQKFKSEVIKYL